MLDGQHRYLPPSLSPSLSPRSRREVLDRYMDYCEGLSAEFEVRVSM